MLLMRMRNKPWAGPELALCPYFIKQPDQQKGRWRSLFPRPEQPMWLELGMGKGRFLCQAALAHPEKNLLGVDLITSILGVARRTIAGAFEEAGRPVENLLFTAHDIERILLMMEPADQVERIYINFCNPWPTGSHHKKRLTHPRQLEKYKTFLPGGGQIHFKTDDDTLFDQSCRYFTDSGFALEAVARDLHRSPFEEESWETEHEAMFSKEGIPTKFLIAVRTD